MYLEVLIGCMISFNIMKAYYRVYYFLYHWLVNCNAYRGLKSLSAHLAVFFISLIGLYFLGFIETLCLCLGMKQIFPASSVFITIALLLIINSLFFLWKKRYLAICEMFQNESRKERIIKNILCVAFILFAMFGMTFLDNLYMK